ncbi:MAG: UvrD-helicase domain-containing protein [Halobacteriota archaeon]|nr:UvrD-helicase domain-containing protein [Halobacteriota archaeon]
MKDRLYPTWDEIEKFHNPLTKGEEKLARFLDDTIPEGWMVFVGPYLNGSRPDIVVFNPQVGVMIYEVKDWDLNSYHWKGEQLYVSDARGSYQIKNPEKQVDHYKKKIIEQLVPSLGEEIDKNKSAYGLVKIGIYFHKASGKDARDFYNNPDYPVIIGYDDLYDSNLRNIVPDSGITKGKYMQEEWANDLLFWLKPPFHSLEQTQHFELTPKQKEHAEPQPGHFRIRGVTGSGKTLVVAYRAAKLASQGSKVLVITYNITLWHYIRDMIARTPFEFERSKITFNHFHGFCNDVLNELGVPSPPGKTYFNDIVPTVENALKTATQRGKSIENLKFDAILIDEGQDYKWEWYNCLCQFLRERDELLLVCDKKQNIYERDLSWIDGKMKKVKFRGKWRELKTVYRLPKKIGDATNRFSSMFGLDQSVEVEKYIQLKLFERPLKPHLVWKNIQSGAWLSHIKNAYELIESAQLKSGEGHPSDIVILLPTKSTGMEAAEYFDKSMQIEVNHVFEDDRESKFHSHKKAFWLGDSRLKMSTIHSFKGWEAVHVILLIPEEWKGLGNLDALVYTAMTRTRENLIVLNCNERYVEYGKSLQSEWDKQ